MTTPNQLLIQAILRTDFYSFVQKVFAEVVPGDAFVPNWHLEAMCYALAEFAAGRRTRQAIAIPPRSLKSIAASIALPSWILGHSPGARIIAVSYSQDLANDFSLKCRQVMKSRWYRELFPATVISADKDTQEYFRTTLGGHRYATSVGGTLTGMGGNFVIIDDPNKAKDMMSDVRREEVLRWYGQTLVSRLDDKVRDGIALVMQRLHEQDLFGHVTANGDWNRLNLPAIAPALDIVPISPTNVYIREAGEVLNPAREPLDELLRIKHDMGALAFAAQYNQDPVPAGGSVVEWAWFCSYAELPRKPDRIVQSWDCASKDTLASDYTACVTAALISDRYYILDVYRARLTFPQLFEKSILQFEQWNPMEILIEDTSAGIQLIQSLKLQRPCRMPVPLPIGAKGDKKVRMHAASLAVEQRRVFLPLNATWLEAFREEIIRFPNTRFDDQVDSFSQLINRWEAKRANPAVAQQRSMFAQ